MQIIIQKNSIYNGYQDDAKDGQFIIFEIEDDINGIGKKNSQPIEVEVLLNPDVLDLEKKLSFQFKVISHL